MKYLILAAALLAAPALAQQKSPPIVVRDANTGWPVTIIKQTGPTTWTARDPNTGWPTTTTTMPKEQQ